MPIDVDRERFEALVDQALDEIPDELAAWVRNVVVLVEDEPPPGEPDDLLGLFDGVALTERDGSMLPQLPDRIFVFRGPLSDWCDTEDQLRDEVRITVVHEVAHHFGIGEERLRELGYG